MDIELLGEGVMRFVVTEKLLETKHVMTEIHMDLMAVRQPVNNRQVTSAMGVHHFAVLYVEMGS